MFHQIGEHLFLRFTYICWFY